jgi:nuclear polyadenylated RNA-binding protein NAB2
MLVNGKTQDEIAAELAADFLNLPADDPTVRGFSGWLFEQIETLNAQLNGQPAADDSMGGVAQDNGHSGDMDTDMNGGAGELNA